MKERLLERIKINANQFFDLNWLAVSVIFVTGLIFFLLLPDKASGYVVASSTALLVAFVAYPWQKQRDREMKLSEERRSAYRRFIEGALDARAEFTLLIGNLKKNLRGEGRRVEISDIGFVFAEFSKKMGHENALLQLVTGDKDIAIKANEINSLMGEVLPSFSERFNSEKQVEAQEVIEQLVSVLEDFKSRFDAKSAELLFLLRDREFSDSPPKK